ncbi:transporter substrate-binding domain-containing protein [Actinokineospora inagensis]|uniref:transporter substrate-binding domain-containing protein n=1 Tax=Actinokineospora inagensis TaxID=103730 RepID=UPI00040BA9AF|nr:transporter substrate-binding domain-containing protein [Actinokineospora inagensis]
MLDEDNIDHVEHVTDDKDDRDGEARRRWVPYVRFVAWCLLGALLVGTAVYVWWQAKPSEQDLRHQALLDTKSELRIGVMPDMPGVSLFDETTKTYSGFDIDIAYMVAADLGFQPRQVRFYTMNNEDRDKASVLDPSTRQSVQLDLVVASYSITDARQAKPYVNFSSPYLRTEQSVVTRAGHAPVRSPADLTKPPAHPDKPEVVCTLGTSTAETPTTQVENRISDCMRRLTAPDHDVDAVLTDAAILAGFVYRDQQSGRNQLKLHNISIDGEERWGISTGGHTDDKEALRKLVNLSLYRSQHDPTDRRWEDAFDRWLGPEQSAAGDQRVAIDVQPDAEKEEVREWPWQTLGLGRDNRTPVEQARLGQLRRSRRSRRRRRAS